VEADITRTAPQSHRTGIVLNSNLATAAMCCELARVGEKKHNYFQIYFTHVAHMEKMVNYKRIIIRICEVRRKLL
jgi:hypothetical protein